MSSVEFLRNGEFGRVELAETSAPDLLCMDGDGKRRCVLKHVNLRKQMQRLLQDCSGASGEDELKAGEKRLARLMRRTVMELFVLGK